MNERHYILQPYKGIGSRHHCPACNKPHIFSRYIDNYTGQDIATNVGRCERLNNCGYHYTPKQYFTDNKIVVLPQSERPLQTKPVPKPPSYIDHEIFKQSLKNYQGNYFIIYLDTLFGSEITTGLINQYNIGTSKHWPGATVFWQVDENGHVRTGKIMLYNPITGKRAKEPYQHITWAHKLINRPDFILRQCLFGEHLLSKEPGKTICLVESEKTAVIASVYFPQYNWLAVGSLANLTAEKCLVIKNQSVLLFPDLKGYEKWQAKAKEISTFWVVSDLLETKATEPEKEKSLDLADYLTRFSYRDFQI